MCNTELYLSKIVNFLADTQFKNAFSKEEIANMSSDEIFIHKMNFRVKYMLHYADRLANDNNIIVEPKFYHKKVYGNYYPDNYIGDKHISDR